MPSDPTTTEADATEDSMAAAVKAAAAAAPGPAGAEPTRRCWRCLQQFPCPPEDVATGPGEWWLCEQCHGTLLPH